MRVTHLGHACLLVETADRRILIDPGNFSSGFEELSGLDAIVVTHNHPDHFDPERVPRLDPWQPRHSGAHRPAHGRHAAGRGADGRADPARASRSRSAT